MLATKASADLARSPIFGCMLWTRAGRSAWALDQSACTLSPTSGHSATRSRGGGISRVLFCTSVTSCCTESPSELIRHGGRRDDQRDPEESQQRRRPALPAAHPGGEHLVQRVQRHGQDQRPDHQGQEGREDPVAEQGQRQDEPGADQDVHQAGSDAAFEFDVWRCHGNLPAKCAETARGIDDCVR